MIVKVKYQDIKNETLSIVMCFGNSYKKWQEQKSEYEYINKNLKQVEIEFCKDEWIGWGGLKWCSFENLQQELNREGCQDNEPNNPNPRKVEKMIFNKI